MSTIRTFSKLKLYGALVQANLWDALVGWLQNQTVHGMNAYTAFTLAQDLSDDHPLFQSWYEQIKKDLGISDEDADRGGDELAVLRSDVEQRTAIGGK